MNVCMAFPETFDEFAEIFGFVDSKEYYTNGSELIQVFRVKQWLENENLRQQAEIERLQKYKVLYEDLKAENIETISCIKSTKAEAIKEFAERLEADLGSLFLVNHPCVGGIIDNLVKEMVGE